ncbi:MAG TPA: hypothetical protein VNJ01_09540 [Bacteriovoracaceae bacterium]|nr:hypothetical protein [Bacteriovoracaceae bacterium]
MKRHLVLTLALLSGSALAERYDLQYNNPNFLNKIIGSKMIFTYDQLPTGGRLMDNRLGWSETYWPSNKGGVAYRWNHPNPQPFTYHLNTREELKAMSATQLSQLSPSELYDISKGDYNYSLTKKVFSKNKPSDLWWEGICHGWAPAAVNYPEPAQVTVRNPDGVNVPFGSSDVKALLSLNDAYNYLNTDYASVGKRCRVNGKVPGEGDNRDANPNPPAPELANSFECKDMNAGAFHVVIANMLGIHSRGFIADIDRFNDVWNQPITGYTSSIVGDESVSAEERMTGVERKIRVKTVMTYGEELKYYTPELAAAGNLNFVSKKPVTMTPNQKFLTKNYEYFIELDVSGKIIGGEWITETRPDFLWALKRNSKFRDAAMPLEALNKIYRPIRR